MEIGITEAKPGNGLPWRPEKIAPIRLVTAVSEVVGRPKDRRRLLDTTVAVFAGELMAELSGGRSTNEQRVIFDKTFKWILDCNDRLDGDFPETQGQVGEALLLEEKYQIPQTIQELKSKAAKTGLDYGNALEEWFAVNRLINAVSYCKSNRINPDGIWVSYKADPHLDGRFVDKIEALFAEVENDPIKTAILFRAISSVAFAKCLVDMNHRVADKQNKVDAVDDNKAYAGKVRRVGSMVMVMQMADDFATIAKDAQLGVLGVSKAAVAGDYRYKKDGRGLMVSENIVWLIVDVSRQVTSACVKAMGLDANNPLKRKIASVMVVAGGVLKSLNMLKEDGGTVYPFSTTVMETVMALQGSIRGTRHADIYKEYTEKTIKELATLLCR